MLQKVVDGRTDLVFEYIAAGNAATSPDSSGTPLIRWCAYHGDVSAIRYLLEHGKVLESLGDNLDLNGANANHPQHDTGEAPLHADLCKANRPVYEAVVGVLLANGANPNATTKRDAETNAFMRDCRTKAETPLHRAAAFGTDRTVQRLLDAGALRDVKDMNGETPLAWASWHLRPASILRILCDGDFSIHPDNHSSYDHGAGWAQPTGRPHD